MKFWESHCHLDFDDFAMDRDNVIAEAANVGVSQIMIPGVTPTDYPKQVEVATASALTCQTALGIHPWFIDTKNPEQQLAAFDQMLAEYQHTVTAIGECGLDFVKPLPELQIHILKHQLRAAIRSDKPVILHHRKSHEPLSQILNKITPKTGVVHGFSGSYQQASRYVDLGFYVGIGGTITYERSQKTRKVIQKLPLTAMVLETDAPAMPLSGKQGKRNHPQYIAEVFHTLCKLRSEAPDYIAAVLWENTERLFS